MKNREQGGGKKTYDECISEYNNNNRANVVLYECPKNYIIIDTDSKEAFNIMNDFYKTSNYEKYVLVHFRLMQKIITNNIFILKLKTI